MYLYNCEYSLSLEQGQRTTLSSATWLACSDVSRIMDSELVGFVRKEIEPAAHVILSGQAGRQYSTENETIDNLYRDAVDRKPSGHAPKRIRLARAAEDHLGHGKAGRRPAKNRMTLGHRDSAPTVALDRRGRLRDLQLRRQDGARFVKLQKDEISFFDGERKGVGRQVQ